MPSEAYLVRGPDGRMLTIRAFSLKGAKDAYLIDYARKLRRGDRFHIRRRMDDALNWTSYQVL